MNLLKSDNRMHQRVIEFCNKVAAHHNFRIDLRPTHANTDLLIAVWDKALVASDTQSKRDLDELKALSEELAFASRLGQMQGCYFREPDAEEMSRITRMFNFGSPRLDFHDKKWSPIPVVRDFSISYDVESDDEAVLRRQPNVQLKLFESNEI